MYFGDMFFSIEIFNHRAIFSFNQCIFNSFNFPSSNSKSRNAEQTNSLAEKYFPEESNEFKKSSKVEPNDFGVFLPI